MTTYAGASASFWLWPTAAPDSPGARTWATDFSDKTPYVYARAAILPSGTKTYGDAGISPAGVSKSGYRFKSFIDDYYYRIHLFPSSINLGTVVSQFDSVISIWNAWFTPVTLDGVSSSAADGVSILGLPAMPHVMGPLKYETYTLRTTTTGPPVIAASFIFDFSVGADLTITVSGQRILVFPFPPNWDSGVSETLDWLTEVLRAYDGTEQRRSLRVTPRRGFDYSILLHDTDTQLFENLLWAWQYRQFVLPIWTDRGLTTADFVAGGVTVLVNTTNLDFVAGSTAVLYKNSKTFEAGLVLSFTGSSVTFQFPLQQNWSAGSRIYPGLISQLPEVVPTQRHTGNILDGRMSFSTSPDKTDAYLPVIAATTIYDGLEVITQQPNWKSAINNDLRHGLAMIDAGTGPIAWMRTETAGQATRPYGWLLKDRAHIITFRQLMQRLRGQAKTVWIPSWHNDMTVVAVTPLGGSSLTIAGPEFANLIGVDTARDRIMVKLTNGNIYYRRVTAVTPVGDTSVLGVDTPFPEQVNPTNTSRVHLLLRCRLAGDKVEIPWRTDSVADPQVTFTTVTA